MMSGSWFRSLGSSRLRASLSSSHSTTPFLLGLHAYVRMLCPMTTRTPILAAPVTPWVHEADTTDMSGTCHGCFLMTSLDMIPM